MIPGEDSERDGNWMLNLTCSSNSDFGTIDIQT
jgi:hypothetical protein